MPAQRRSPTVIMFTVLCLIAGLWFGLNAMRQGDLRRGLEAVEANLADFEIIDGSAEDFAAAGRPLAKQAPHWHWSHIHYRNVEDMDGNFLRLVRCQVDADRVKDYVGYDLERRQPAEDRPPAHWPWFRDVTTSATHPYRIPDWWEPAGDRSIFFEGPAGERARLGFFANYDHKTRWLHVWQWQQVGWPIPPEGMTERLPVDILVQMIQEHLVQIGSPATPKGWLATSELTPRSLELLNLEGPKGLTSIDLTALPLRGRHRYLVALRGIDESEALAALGDTPLREAAVDSPMPKWLHAVPENGMPPWFTPGPGPRWTHTLHRLGSGKIDGARWAAYDVAAKTLYVWDWVEPSPINP